MARQLTTAQASVAPADRVAYLEAVAALADHHRRHGGHFWLFESREVPGTFLEFAEAAGALVAPAASLATRLAALARYQPGHDAAWEEVPLADHDGG